MIPCNSLPNALCHRQYSEVSTVIPMLREHCHETALVLKDQIWQKVLFFSATEAATNGHLPSETTFVWRMGWSKTEYCMNGWGGVSFAGKTRSPGQWWVGVVGGCVFVWWLCEWGWGVAEWEGGGWGWGWVGEKQQTVKGTIRMKLEGMQVKILV